MTYNHHQYTFSAALFDYTISEDKIKPDHENLQPLNELLLSQDINSQHCNIDKFSCYSHWTANYLEKVAPLIQLKTFPLLKMA